MQYPLVYHPTAPGFAWATVSAQSRRPSERAAMYPDGRAQALIVELVG